MSDFARFRAVSTVVWFIAGSHESAFVLRGTPLNQCLKLSVREALR